jgi:vacuolar protein sorting-associated protein 29
MQHILCTGNVCSKQVLNHLRTIAGNVYVAKGAQRLHHHYQFHSNSILGDFDFDLDFPEHHVVSIGNFKIGVM